MKELTAHPPTTIISLDSLRPIPVPAGSDNGKFYYEVVGMNIVSGNTPGKTEKQRSVVPQLLFEHKRIDGHGRKRFVHHGDHGHHKHRHGGHHDGYGGRGRFRGRGGRHGHCGCGGRRGEGGEEGVGGEVSGDERSGSIGDEENEVADGIQNDKNAKEQADMEKGAEK